MAYKQKTCPKCGATHKKRGEFCSRSCGNTRPHKPETKLAIATTQAIRHTSGDAVAEEQRWIIAQVNGAVEPLLPTKPIDLGLGRFVEDGDLWEEC